MDKPETRQGRVDEPAVPATPDGRPPYADPLPLDDAGAPTPDGTHPSVPTPPDRVGEARDSDPDR
jgi:hypothetical protein